MKHLPRLIALALVPMMTAGVLSACAPAGTPAPEDGGLRLAENGKTDFRVVIGANASEDIRKMAAEFSDYFQKITGAAIETVTDDAEMQEKEICIGRTNRPLPDAHMDPDKMPAEALYCKADGCRLTLTGGSDRGVAYAVYDFLEKACGVRYYTPDYEKVPEHPTLSVPADYCVYDKPVFWFRTLEGAGAGDPKWNVKMRLNSRQSLGSKNFRRDLFAGGGHGYADWFVHTIAKLAETPASEKFQPCLSDEKTYQTVLKNVRAWLEKYPDATLVSISQNDGNIQGEVACGCDKCRAVYEEHGCTNSALWVKFVSRIAEELKDEYPDVYFDTLAYIYTLTPPTGLTVPDNVIIRLAPLSKCYTHPSLACADMDGGNIPMRTAQTENALKGWGRICKNIFIWDYTSHFADYLAPLFQFDTLRENLALYAGCNVRGVLVQGDAQNGFCELCAYLSAKLAWKPDMTKEEMNALISDFCEGYYGEGTAEALLRVLDLWNGACGDSHTNSYSTLAGGLLAPAACENADGTVTLDTAALIDPVKACFDKAESVKKTEEQALHLKKARTQIKYYEICSLFYLEKNDPGAVFDRAYRTALGEELYQDLKAVGITELREGAKLTDTPNFDYPPLEWGKK